MSLSQIASVMSISQLIQPFSTEDTRLFKKQLFDRFSILDEKDFISKFLLYSTKFVHHDALSQAHNDAHEISTKSEYPTVKPRDYLSKLSSDIMNCIGTFLSTDASLTLGNVNRHLYIQTQLKSFIVKRNEAQDTKLKNSSILARTNCNTTILDRKIISALNISNITGYGYGFPISIKLGVDSFNYQDIGIETAEKVLYNPMKRCYFNNFFCNLQRLNIENTYLASYIPVSILFNKNMNKKKLELLKILYQEDIGSGTSWEVGYNQFLRNYEKYFQNECDGDNNKIRQIKELCVTTKGSSMMRSMSEEEEEQANVFKFELNLLFQVLNGTFEELILDKCQLGKVDYNCLVKYIVHPRLKKLSIDDVELEKSLIQEIEKRTQISMNKDNIVIENKSDEGNGDINIHGDVKMRSISACLKHFTQFVPSFLNDIPVFEEGDDFLWIWDVLRFC